MLPLFNRLDYTNFRFLPFTFKSLFIWKYFELKEFKVIGKEIIFNPIEKNVWNMTIMSTLYKICNRNEASPKIISQPSVAYTCIYIYYKICELRYQMLVAVIIYFLSLLSYDVLLKELKIYINTFTPKPNA